jgi:hypothetical protein
MCVVLTTGVSEEVTATALATETECRHCTALCGNLGGAGKIDKFIRLGATVSPTVGLNKIEILLPLAGNRQIARVAANGNGKVHGSASLLRGPAFRFSSLPEETMRITYRALAILGLVLVVVLGFGWLVAPSDIKMKVIQKDIQKDHSRFTPAESIDIAQAMKLVTHDQPQMLAPTEPVPPLLLYPPSDEDLARLSGP